MRKSSEIWGICATIVLALAALGASPAFTRPARNPPAVTQGRFPGQPRSAQPEPVQSLTGHTDGVRDLCFSPDGSRIASASNDRTLRLWDVKTGKELHVFKGHTSRVCGIRFSRDGKRLISAGEDATARIWDTDTGELLYQFDTKFPRVRMAAFDPDGKRVYIAQHQTDLSEWSIDEESKRRSFPGRGMFVHSAAISPDGSMLAAGGCFGSITVWDTKTGRVLLTDQHQQRAILAIAFTADSSKLAATGLTAPIKVWDLKTAKTILEWPEKDGAGFRVTGSGLAISPDGRFIALAATTEAQVFELATMKHVARIYHGADVMHTCAFSPDGALLATGGGGMADGDDYLPSYDNTIRLWELAKVIEMQKKAE